MTRSIRGVFLLSFLLFSVCAVVKGEPDSLNSTGTAKKAILLTGFPVAGHTGTAIRPKLWNAIPVVGVTGASVTRARLIMASAKPTAPAPKRPMIDTRPMPAPSTRENLTYADDIRPIFEANCLDCHGELNQFADLRLDTLEFVLKGAESGKVIVPGKSRQSFLVTAIVQFDDKTAMPPLLRSGKPNRLSAKEIGLIRAWIIQGAR